MENAMLFEHNKKVPKRIPISSHKFSIGRGLDNSYVVDDISVSRRHSILEFQNNQWYLYDMSSNGTWINELLINKNGSHLLKEGDIIKLSESYQYVFKIMPLDASARTLSEDEIVHAAEEVIANVEAFNKEFSIDSNELHGDVKCESSVVSLSENSNVPLNQPGTSMDDSNVPLSGSNASQEKKLCPNDVIGIEFVENELQCSICTEMFVKAVTLTCSHTFCSYCIEQWQKTKMECPICRTRITAKCSTKVIDSYIDRVIETSSDEFKKHRQQIVAQREAFTAQIPSTSALKVLVPAVEISSEEEYMEDSDEDSYSADSIWDDGDGTDSDGRTPYYGGYGRCYTCGSKGHWANSCPVTRNRNR